MLEDPTPKIIPREIVEYLESRYPVKNPSPGTPQDRLMYAAGQASVAIHLRALYREASGG